MRVVTKVDVRRVLPETSCLAEHCARLCLPREELSTEVLAARTMLKGRAARLFGSPRQQRLGWCHIYFSLVEDLADQWWLPLDAALPGPLKEYHFAELHVR